MEVAIRDATVAAAGGANLFADVRTLGARAIEIELTPEMTTPHLRRGDGTAYSCSADAGIQELHGRLNVEGLRVAALLLATDFSGEHAREHGQWAARACAAAEVLGAPVIRIDPLNLDKSLDGEEVRQRFVSGVRGALTTMGNSKVNLGIENHGPIANDPAWLDTALAEIDDPRVGLTLDTGNFYWYGFPLEEMYGLLEKYASRAKHTHLKNINFPPADANRRREVGFEYKARCCPLHEGNLDLKRIVSILQKSGYSRSLCIEDESLFKVPPERKLDVLHEEVRALTAAMA